MNFLPGNEASEQQRHYRTGYRDSMLQCGRVGMADYFERDPRLVSLPIRGWAGVGLGFLSAGSFLNLSSLIPIPPHPSPFPIGSSSFWYSFFQSFSFLFFPFSFLYLFFLFFFFS